MTNWWYSSHQRPQKELTVYWYYVNSRNSKLSDKIPFPLTLLHLLPTYIPCHRCSLSPKSLFQHIFDSKLILKPLSTNRIMKNMKKRSTRLKLLFISLLISGTSFCGWQTPSLDFLKWQTQKNKVQNPKLCVLILSNKFHCNILLIQHLYLFYIYNIYQVLKNIYKRNQLHLFY